MVLIALLTALTPTRKYTVQLLEHWKSQHCLHCPFLNNLCEMFDHIRHLPEIDGAETSFTLTLKTKRSKQFPESY